MRRDGGRDRGREGKARGKMREWLSISTPAGLRCCPVGSAVTVTVTVTDFVCRAPWPILCAVGRNRFACGVTGSGLDRLAGPWRYAACLFSVLPFPLGGIGGHIAVVLAVGGVVCMQSDSAIGAGLEGIIPG